MQPDEKNRRLAIWLGWNVVGSRMHSPACQRDEELCNGKPPDFYVDEAASAMLREKVRASYHINISLRKLVKVCIKFKRTQRGRRGSNWELIYSEGPAMLPVIAEACLKLIEKEG